METYILAFLQALTAIVVAWLGKSANEQKKDREAYKKVMDERESRREQRDKFLLEYMDVAADLAEAQTVAIVNGRNNGELHRAQEGLNGLRNRYSSWLRDCAVKEAQK